MATTHGQVAVSCQLCSKPVKKHCKSCAVDLCNVCILKHQMDNVMISHEVVEYIDRIKGYNLSECKTHEKIKCEMYCKECSVPICTYCVTDPHNRHDVVDIWGMIKIFDKNVKDDLSELEDDIAPKYRNIDIPCEQFDKVISSIKEQENSICKAVREIGTQMRQEVTKKKRESENKKSETKKLEKEINEIIKTNRKILKSSDAGTLMSYSSKNSKYRHPKLTPSCPQFLPGLIEKEQISGIFGKLSKEQKQPNLYLSSSLSNSCSNMKNTYNVGFVSTLSVNNLNELPQKVETKDNEWYSSFTLGASRSAYKSKPDDDLGGFKSKEFNRKGLEQFIGLEDSKAKPNLKSNPDIFEIPSRQNRSKSKYRGYNRSPPPGQSNK